MTACDKSSTDRSPWVTFAICAGGAYITTLDLSIVNVAFPEIARTFASVSRAHVSWVVTIYNIFFGSLLLAGGKMADRLGRKRLFVSGTALFIAGSALAGFAPTLRWLIVGRAIQGTGGALLAPATLGLLLAAFPPWERTRIVSLWGAVGALGVASGPSVGALLIELTDWRAAFLVNVPVCGAALLAGRSYLAETPRQTGPRADIAGALLVTLALAAAALGISQSEEWGLTDPRVFGSLAVAVVLIPLFLMRQRRHPEPILDLSLFSARPFSVANASTLLFAVGFGALGLNNVLFLRGVWGWSVLHAGLASAVGPLVVAITAPRSARLSKRAGFRNLIVAGSLVVGLAVTLFMTAIDETPRLALWLGISVLMGLGIGLVLPLNSAAAVSQLPPERFGIGGAVNNVSRQVGSVLGVALLVALLGTPTSGAEALAAHRRGWMLVTGSALLSAAVSLLHPSRQQTNAI